MTAEKSDKSLKLSEKISTIEKVKEVCVIIKKFFNLKNGDVTACDCCVVATI